MKTIETNGGGAEAISPNQKMLIEFVDWARNQNVRPHMLLARGANGAPTPVGPVWLLRPPTEGTRYQKPQPGVACNASGSLYRFNPNDHTRVVELQRSCPAEGIDPSGIDETWMSTLLDTAEANIEAAAATQMNGAEFEAWGRTRQAAGMLSVAAA